MTAAADTTTTIPPTPNGTLTPHLTCRDAAAAYAFYQEAFGAEPLCLLPAPDGRVMHAALRVNGATILLVDEFPEHGAGGGPLTLGGTPVTLHLQVPDCDAVYDRAVAAGCAAVMPPEEMFWGDRWGLLSDPFGHRWSVATSLPPRPDADAFTVTRPGDCEIVMTRSFAAPREWVFDALTCPELIARWMTPLGAPAPVCETDPRVGGAWRYDFGGFAMKGTYREVVRPERIVLTESYEGCPAADWPELLVTTDLTERDGRTLVATTVRHPSPAIRDANTCMEDGARMAYDRLAALLTGSAAK